MRFYTWFSIGMILLFGLFVNSYMDKGGSIDNINQNLSDIMLNDTFELVKNVPYKNPYSENFTVTDFVYNTIHPIFYLIACEINTISGVALNYSYKALSLGWVKLLCNLIIGYFAIVLMLKAITPIGVLYVFITESYVEKFNKKMHPIYGIVLATVSLIILIGLLFLILSLTGIIL